MKVLMTADTVGGVWTYCMDLCAALAAYDVAIDLATMGRALSAEQQRQVANLPHVTLHESEYRLCWMNDSEQDVANAGDWLLALERELDPDVIQLNDLAHGGLAWQTPVVLVAHSCVFSWWQAVMGRLPPMDEWGIYHRMVSASVQQADVVVAPTQAMLKAFTSHYGPAQKTAVIYNGRDFPTQNLASGGEDIIFAAGRIWDPAKNIGMLSDVTDEVPWPIYAAGEQADPNGGSNRPAGINCLGFLDSEQIAEWLQRAKIFVAPAHYEPFGLSALEAARSKCALVLGDIASLREVWGDAAEYVNPSSPDQLRRTLTGLIEDPDHCQNMAERAQQRAIRYTRSRMAAHYMQCYRQTIQKSAANPNSPNGDSSYISSDHRSSTYARSTYGANT